MKPGDWRLATGDEIMMRMPTTKASDPRPGDVRLTIRPVPNGRDGFGRDPSYRLKLLLKRMLRAFGWRCVAIDEVTTMMRSET